MLVLKDFSTSVLASTLAADAVSVDVADAGRFPVLSAGSYFYAVLQKFVDRTHVEIVKVVGVAGNTFTVVRGQAGTVPRVFAAGDYIELRLTVGVFEEYVAQRVAHKIDSVGGVVQQALLFENAADGVRASYGTLFDGGHATVVGGAEGANAVTPSILLRPLGKGNSTVQAAYSSDGMLYLSGGRGLLHAKKGHFFEGADGIGWPDSSPGSLYNYARQWRTSVQANNSALFLVGDSTLDARRFGFQVGNADPALSQQVGTLELNPYGGDVKVNGGLVFHTKYLPTPAAIGAVTDHAWAGVVKLGTWSPICRLYPDYLSGKMFITVGHTRNSFVCNATFLVSCGHNGFGTITQLESHGYSQISVRVSMVGDYAEFEIFDTDYTASPIGTDVQYNVKVHGLYGSLDKYTVFTESTGLPKEVLHTEYKAIKIGNNKVYNQGFMPTPAELGAAASGYGVGEDLPQSLGGDHDLNTMRFNGFRAYNRDTGDRNGAEPYGTAMDVGHYSNGIAYAGWGAQLFIGVSGKLHKRINSEAGSFEGSSWHQLYDNSAPVILLSDTKGALVVENGSSAMFRDGAGAWFHQFARGNELVWGVGADGSLGVATLSSVGAFSASSTIFGSTAIVSQGPQRQTWLGLESVDTSDPYISYKALGMGAPVVGINFKQDRIQSMRELFVNTHQVYHKGFKPTAAELGVLPVEGNVDFDLSGHGSNLPGHLYFNHFSDADKVVYLHSYPSDMAGVPHRSVFVFRSKDGDAYRAFQFNGVSNVMDGALSVGDIVTPLLNVAGAGNSISTLGGYIRSNSAAVMSLDGKQYSFVTSPLDAHLCQNSYWDGESWLKYRNDAASGHVVVKGGALWFHHSDSGHVDPNQHQQLVYHTGRKPTAAEIGAAPSGYGLGGYGANMPSVLGNTELRRVSGFFQGSNIEGLPAEGSEWKYIFSQAHANAAGYFGYLAIDFHGSKAWIGSQEGGLNINNEIALQRGRFLAGSPVGNDYNQGAVEVFGSGPSNLWKPTIGFHQAGLWAASLSLWGNGEFRFYKQGLSAYASIIAGNINVQDVFVRSDARLHANFSVMRDALSKLKQLTGYFYDKKDTLSATDYNKHEFGLIAKDVERVLPAAISRFVDSEDAAGAEVLSISNAAISALLVEAVKELDARLSSAGF